MKRFCSFLVILIILQLSLFSQTKFFLHQVDVSDFPLVKVYISVLDDAGTSIKGLDKNNFVLTDSGIPIRKFESSSIFPNREWIAVVLALDKSGSMEGRPLDDAKKGACVFIEKAGLLDQIALLLFDEEVYWITDFTGDKELLLKKIEAVMPQKNTALHDALFQSLEKLTGIQAPRKAVVILTDGKDTESEKSQTECLKKIQDTKIPVYIIGLGENINRDFIELAAEESHGNSYFAVTSSDLQNIYASIAAQLENQYIISYTFEDKKRPGIHALEIEMNYGGEKLKDKILYSLDTYALAGVSGEQEGKVNGIGILAAAAIGGIIGLIAFLLIGRQIFMGIGISRGWKVAFVFLGILFFMIMGGLIYYFF
ncbi:MAG: VWA domain-containing protein [Candidatus Aminicenantes bacterium]|nr:VWA domain-containing protein [Candidatus Aminicenantes bacterium]